MLGTPYTCFRSHTELAANFLLSQESHLDTRRLSAELPRNPDLTVLAATIKVWLSVREQLTTPLHVAVRTNNPTQLNSCLENPSLRGYISARDGFGNTPLHWSAFNGSQEFSIRLLELGSQLTQNFEGNTPIHLAAWEGSKKVCSILRRKNLNPNYRPEILGIQNNKGNTPAHLALLAGHVKLAANLTIFSSEDKKNNLGFTPSELAEELKMTLFAKYRAQALAEAKKRRQPKVEKAKN